MERNLRPVGTRYQETWCTYQRDSEGAIDGHFSRMSQERHYSRTLEVTAHENGKEVCRVIDERM